MGEIKALRNQIDFMKAEGWEMVRNERNKAKALARYRIKRTLEAVNAAASDPKARAARGDVQFPHVGNGEGTT
jgi:predicted nucleotidyltransferase